MKSFDELPLKAPLRQAIKELGFEVPSPIQAQALPKLLGKSTDFIGLAATGTGKTAAFGIPMLEQIDPQNKWTQALIMCPTRELALQVAGQINLLGKHLKISVLPIYGGAGYDAQNRGLKSGAQIVVGTPGRLIDHLNRGTLKLDRAKTIILDEADEMISMGFKEDLEALLKAIPRDKSHIWLFSATLEAEVRRVANTYLKKPEQVQVNQDSMLSATVKQYFFKARESDKAEVLCKLIENADDFYGLIFCQTKSLVADLTEFLNQKGYKVGCLHGDKNQLDREITMKRFREKSVRMLVCTDVASRGLDVKDVTHVINYSVPREMDNYIHRIGRTARCGKEGTALNLVTPAQMYLLGRIEKLTKSRIIEGKIPSDTQINAKRVSQILEKFLAQEKHTHALKSLQDPWLTAIEDMDRKEIVSRFLMMSAPELFEEKKKKKTMLGIKNRPEGAPKRERQGGGRSFKKPNRRFKAGFRSEGKGSFRKPSPKRSGGQARRAD